MRVLPSWSFIGFTLLLNVSLVHANFCEDVLLEKSLLAKQEEKLQTDSQGKFDSWLEELPSLLLGVTSFDNKMNGSVPINDRVQSVRVTQELHPRSYADISYAANWSVFHNGLGKPSHWTERLRAKAKAYGLKFELLQILHKMNDVGSVIEEPFQLWDFEQGKWMPLLRVVAGDMVFFHSSFQQINSQSTYFAIRLSMTSNTNLETLTVTK